MAEAMDFTAKIIIFRTNIKDLNDPVD